MKKKKLLVIGMTDLLGGVEIFIRNIYENFDYDKYDVDFLSHSEKEILFENIFNENGSGIYYCEKFLRHPFRAYQKLKSVYKSGEYDVVHCNACSSSMIIYFFPALHLKKRPLIVMHSHSAGEKGGKILRHFFVRPILNQNVDRRLACSDKAGEWMFGKKHSFQIISNGVNINDFLFNEEVRERIRKYYGYSDEDILIGSVGRLEEVKNHQFLIDVMQKLDMRYKCVIIGDGELRDRLQKRIYSNGLSDRVKILNSTSKINEYYQAFDLYAMPSKFEGLPMTCVEAQLSGLPILLSNKISKDAKLSDDVQFLSIQDSEDWVNAISRAKLNMRRKNINPDLINRFDCRNTAKQLCDLFNEDLDSRSLK